MVGRHVKRRPEARPTTQMHKDELLNLLTDSEREVAQRHRAKTTVQPVDTTTAIEEEPFRIDTRELDARVFQKHALGTAKPVPVLQPVEEPAVIEAPIEAAPFTAVIDEPAESTELVAPLSRVQRIPLYVSLLAAMLVLLLVAVGK